MLPEILIVFTLTLVNGVLAMSELAVVSSRTTRLKVMAESGNRGAEIAIRLAAEPGRFLSSVQIGITLVGILSGAFSGATLGVRLANFLASTGLSPALAHAIGVGSVVVAITYLSLVFGELVPKQIALRAPETAAVRIAPLLNIISIVAAPIVWLLDKSGKVILAILGQSNTTDSGVTDEEIRLILSEARSTGVLEETETEMIAGVMRIADRRARGLMVPRLEVDLVNITDDPETVAARFLATGHSRLPVRNGGPDDIIGIINSRVFLGAKASGTLPDWRDLIVEAPIVQDGMPALDMLEKLRSAPSHMVFVYDEYGHFEGIITPMNMLEAIVGEFPEGKRTDAKIISRQDGSLMVAGWMPVDEFAERIGVEVTGARDYTTVAGLVLDRMGVLPQLGEHFELGRWRIEIVEMDGRRIDKLLVQQKAA